MARRLRSMSNIARGIIALAIGFIARMERSDIQVFAVVDRWARDFVALNRGRWIVSLHELAHATFHLLQTRSTPVAAIRRHPGRSRRP
jgi:hypothetical protein